MLVPLVEALFMFSALVALVALVTVAMIGSAVGAELWAVRHRERAIVREARRLTRRARLTLG